MKSCSALECLTFGEMPGKIIRAKGVFNPSFLLSLVHCGQKNMQLRLTWIPEPPLTPVRHWDPLASQTVSFLLPNGSYSLHLSGF
jgi:hypothetical protein